MRFLARTNDKRLFLYYVITIIHSDPNIADSSLNVVGRFNQNEVSSDSFD